MKKEAEDAVQLLAPLVERKREEELKVDGSSRPPSSPLPFLLPAFRSSVSSEA